MKKMDKKENKGTMARGSGKERKRIWVTVPVYENVHLDEEDLDALKLPQKFAKYRRVLMTDIRHQKMVTDSKT